MLPDPRKATMTQDVTYGLPSPRRGCAVWSSPVLLVCVALCVMACICLSAVPSVQAAGSVELAATQCNDCTAAERSALRRLGATSGRITGSKGPYRILDVGVVVHEDCLATFGPTFPATVQAALKRGISCLSAGTGATAHQLIHEMAQVLARSEAPAPVVLCRPLESRNMKGVGLRSDAPDRSPVIKLNPVLTSESDAFVQSVIFHEFIHLGGDGHGHGSRREVASPCQQCCFSARSYDRVGQPYACTVCMHDYPDKFDPGYLDDLKAWALRSPGSEFLFRINKLDGVKRAGGSTAFLYELVQAFADHPFGFELARVVLDAGTFPAEARRRIESVARKRHGHVTKRFIAYARSVAEAVVARFTGPDTLESAPVTTILLQSHLPDKADVPKEDLPYFYKYYYEFALLRGVLAEEAYALWRVHARTVCAHDTQSPPRPYGDTMGIVGAVDALTREATPGVTTVAVTQCEEATAIAEVLRCQKAGLEFDVHSGVCR